MGGVSVWQLVIVLIIVLLIFGTKKFKNLGSDLGSAVKGFKSAMSDSEQSAENKTTETLANKSNSSPIDAEVLKDVMKDPMKKEEQKKEGSKKDV